MFNKSLKSYFCLLVLIGGWLVLTTACDAVKPTVEAERPASDAAAPTVQVSSEKRRKIVAFGDSLTAGLGLLEKESYPYLLQQRLTAEGYDYEVVNAGVSGDTSAGGLDRINWSLNQPNVEILILELGANDMLRGQSVAKMKQNLGEIIERAKAKNIKVLLCGMYAPTSMGADYQRQYTAAFKDLAAEHRVAFLPFFLEGVGGIKSMNQADGIHPNATGAKLITETVYKAARPLLKK